jgi:hypothetical protein
MKRINDRWVTAAVMGVILVFAGFITCTGCTAVSTKLAIEGSRRTDEVRTAVVDRQHRSLLILSYRETLAELNKATSDQERAAILNEAWNNRDLFEFWYIQDVLARAMHYATVDAKLAASQSIIDLLLKDMSKRAETPLQAADEYLAAKVGAAATQKAED